MKRRTKRWIFVIIFVFTLAIISIGLPLAAQFSLRQSAREKIKEDGVVCAQVVTRACFAGIPFICREFDTPCQVPVGWLTKKPV